MKNRVILTLCVVIYAIVIMISCLSKAQGSNIPESILSHISEYIDGQPVKYQRPLKRDKKEIKYPPNYLLIWTAKWCVNCPLMKTLGDKLEKEDFDVFYIDFDKNEEKAKESMIGVLPTAIIYTDGEEVKRVVGIKRQTKKIVEAQIREALEKNEEEEKKPNDYDIY